MKNLSAILVTLLLVFISGCSNEGQAHHFGLEKHNGVGYFGIEIHDGNGQLTKLAILESSVQGIFVKGESIEIEGREITVPNGMNLVVAQKGKEVRFYEMEASAFQKKPRDIEMFVPYLDAE